MRSHVACGKHIVFGIITCFIVVIGGCKEDSKDLYEKAIKAYQGGDYQKAVELFERILQKYPDHSLVRRAHYELGNIYFYKLKQPQKALKHLQDLYAQSQPGKYSLEALKLIGYIYDNSLNDCLKGVEAYRLLLRDYASEIEADTYQYAISDCYFKLHDYELATQEYQRLLEQYPESPSIPRAKFQIATSHALQEEWEQAIALYEALLLSDNLSAQLLVDIKLELGFCYEHEEEFEKALKLYQELTDVDPETVVIDTALLERKIDRVQEMLEASNKKPQDVNWKRNKK